LRLSVDRSNNCKIHHIKALSFICLLMLSSLVTAVELSNPALEGSDGVTHHLKDFIGKGRWGIMVVWGAKCPACLEEMPDVQGLYDRRDTTNIDVVGLVIDYPSFDFPDIQEVQLYEEDNFLTFPNLMIDYQVFADLGLGRLKGTPTIIVLNPKGEAVDMRVGVIPMSEVERVIRQRRHQK